MNIQTGKKLVAEYREKGDHDMAYMAMLDIIKSLEAALPDPEKLKKILDYLDSPDESYMRNDLRPCIEKIEALNLGSNEEFVVYADGLGTASICTSLKDDEAIVKRMNAVHPSGTTNGWLISKDKTFRDEINTNPCQCNDHPLTHRHFLMEW